MRGAIVGSLVHDFYFSKGILSMGLDSFDASLQGVFETTTYIMILYSTRVRRLQVGIKYFLTQSSPGCPDCARRPHCRYPRGWERPRVTYGGGMLDQRRLCDWSGYT